MGEGEGRRGKGYQHSSSRRKRKKGKREERRGGTPRGVAEVVCKLGSTPQKKVGVGELGVEKGAQSASQLSDPYSGHDSYPRG